MTIEMRLPELPKSRPEIWRLAIFLHKKFSKESWVIADKVGWYRIALEIHNEVYRQSSPHLQHNIPIEAAVITIEPLSSPLKGNRV